MPLSIQCAAAKFRVIAHEPAPLWALTIPESRVVTTVPDRAAAEAVARVLWTIEHAAQLLAVNSVTGIDLLERIATGAADPSELQNVDDLCRQATGVSVRPNDAPRGGSYPMQFSELDSLPFEALPPAVRDALPGELRTLVGAVARHATDRRLRLAAAREFTMRAHRYVEHSGYRYDVAWLSMNFDAGELRCERCLCAFFPEPHDSAGAEGSGAPGLVEFVLDGGQLCDRECPCHLGFEEDPILAWADPDAHLIERAAAVLSATGQVQAVLGLGPSLLVDVSDRRGLVGRPVPYDGSRWSAQWVEGRPTIQGPGRDNNAAGRVVFDVPSSSPGELATQVADLLSSLAFPSAAAPGLGGSNGASGGGPVLAV